MTAQVMFYSSAVFFIAVSALNLHLQTEFEPKQVRLRKISKALLMPALLLFMVSGLYSGRAAQVSGSGGMIFIVAAVIFSWAGDVFLIWPGNKAFIGGLASFLVGHLAYLVYFNLHVDYRALPLGFYALAVVILWYGVILFKGVGPKPGIRVGMLVYMFVIGGMIFSSMGLFYQNMGLNSALILLGALLFGSSDSVLAFRRLADNRILPESYVMFSYISGQFLIVVGALSEYIPHSF